MLWCLQELPDFNNLFELILTRLGPSSCLALKIIIFFFLWILLWLLHRQYTGRGILNLRWFSDKQEYISDKLCKWLHENKIQ